MNINLCKVTAQKQRFNYNGTFLYKRLSNVTIEINDKNSLNKSKAFVDLFESFWNGNVLDCFVVGMQSDICRYNWTKNIIIIMKNHQIVKRSLRWERFHWLVIEF